MDPRQDLLQHLPLWRWARLAAADLTTSPLLLNPGMATVIALVAGFLWYFLLQAALLLRTVSR